MTTFLLLFSAGLGIGLYDSVVGSGGLALVSILTLLNIPPLSAIGTMRVVTLVQEAVSTAAFWRKDLIDWKLASILSAIVMVGAILGASVVLHLPQKWIPLIVGVLMILLASAIPFLRLKTKARTRKSLFEKFTARIRRIREQASGAAKRRTMIMAGLVFLLGIYGGFYGAGFGTFALLLFTLVGRLPLIESAANARVVGLTMSSAAGILFISRGNVNWDIAPPLLLGTIVGAWYGVELADRWGTRYIKILLTLVVLASGIKLLLPFLG